MQRAIISEDVLHDLTMRAHQFARGAWIGTALHLGAVYLAEDASIRSTLLDLPTLASRFTIRARAA